MNKITCFSLKTLLLFVVFSSHCLIAIDTPIKNESSSTSDILIKDDTQVFLKWREWQRIMPDIQIALMPINHNELFLSCLKQTYEKNITLLQPLIPLLSQLTCNTINPYGYELRTSTIQTIEHNFSNLYQLIDNDMQGLIEFFKNSELLNYENITSEEAGETSHNIIEKYTALSKVLFAKQDEETLNQYLFSVANIFFEYCFSENTYPLFEKLLLDKNSYAIPRLLYAIMWYNLAGNGWKHWHTQSLQYLQKAADLDNEIVYIAGGSDIYQMIKAGIFNIRNIDPQLPSQPKYYTNDWSFILHGNIGDSIKITCNNGKKIIMTRTNFQEHGTTFKVRIATGEIIELPNSTTTWEFFDENETKLGQYILERRFCTQEDFYYAPNKTLLISFNELYFISLPGFLNGWQIDPTKFDPRLTIFVKQLRKPVTKQMIINMHVATLLNASDFKFIALGTCIN